jgi:hypothetical protein
MGYTYLPDFPQSSRARVEAAKIQAELELDASKQHVRRLLEYETEVKKYLLTVFSVFAEEALVIGHQGVWTVETIDTQAREFLGCLALESQLQKGHDRGAKYHPTNKSSIRPPASRSTTGA